ncbi:MAG: hypothetical protein ACR2OW_15230 [Methyloligellaceae bacterium]
MDVLKSWQPEIDANSFHRGELSEEIWDQFLTLVKLCHAHKHWKQRAQEARETPLPAEAEDNDFLRRKLRRDRKTEISRREALMYRAAYQAKEKADGLLKLSELGGDADRTLAQAVDLALQARPSYEKARCEALMFSTFDGDQQLKGSAADIALRWSTDAGIKILDGANQLAQ